MDSSVSHMNTADSKKKLAYNPLRPGKNPLKPLSQQNSRSSLNLGSDINVSSPNLSINEKVNDTKPLQTYQSTTNLTDSNSSNNSFDPHKTIYVDQNKKENTQNDKIYNEVQQLSKSISNLRASRSNMGSSSSLFSNPLAPRSNPLAPQKSQTSLLTKQTSTLGHSSITAPEATPVPVATPAPAPAAAPAPPPASAPVETPVPAKQTPAPPPPTSAPIPAPAPAPAPVATPVPTKQTPAPPPPTSAPTSAPAPVNQAPAPAPAEKTNTSSQNDTPIDRKNVICAACNEKITGSIVSADNKFYHQRHFICSKCSKSLCNSIFNVIDDTLYCIDCYNDKCGIKCASCNQYIDGEYISTSGKNWHPEHFCCNECNKPLGGSGGFKEKDDKVYCIDDYQKLFGICCAKCSKPIPMGGYITALEKPWHVECFVCNVCGEPFSTTSFYEIDGFPYCSKHYELASICGYCNSKIMDKRVKVGDKFYHGEHIFCTCCKNPISSLISGNDDIHNYFQITNNNVVCKKCQAF